MNAPDLSPDPKSKPAPVAGSHVSETTTVTESFTYAATCPRCETQVIHHDRAMAVAMATRCCTGAP